MSVYPCSVCRQRRPGKLASAYWAWFNADGARSAWKVRYCHGCAAESLSKLFQKLRETDGTSDVFACVSCGTDASQDSDPIYLTLYLPGKEPEEIALQLDGACAAKLRIPITTQGERLADRGGVVRGPSPLTTAWDALGLSPS
jgi:HSP20 family molecular chaperone IbpA